MEDEKSLLDTPFARLIALLIALGIAYILYSNWGAELLAIFQGQPGPVPLAVETSAAPPANPALDECLAKRVGDVDAMKDEGIISEAQYSTFRARAEELCHAQNPG